MRKLLILPLLLIIGIVISWCDKSHNFMDVDNPNAKEDFKALFWSWKNSNIVPKDIIPDGLSWSWENVKWYAWKYYSDTVEDYVDKAKDSLSWAVKNLKDYYNSWVDQLTNTINDKVTWAISWELNKIKL